MSRRDVLFVGLVLILVGLRVLTVEALPLGREALSHLSFAIGWAWGIAFMWYLYGRGARQRTA